MHRRFVWNDTFRTDIRFSPVVTFLRFLRTVNKKKKKGNISYIIIIIFFLIPLSEQGQLSFSKFYVDIVPFHIFSYPIEISTIAEPTEISNFSCPPTYGLLLAVFFAWRHCICFPILCLKASRRLQRCPVIYVRQTVHRTHEFLSAKPFGVLYIRYFRTVGYFHRWWLFESVYVRHL